MVITGLVLSDMEVLSFSLFSLSVRLFYSLLLQQVQTAWEEVTAFSTKTPAVTPNVEL